MNDLANYSIDALRWEIERRETEPIKPEVVTYTIYLYSSKDSAWEAAREAGFSDEEIRRFELMYVGYEVPLKITVDRRTGKYTEEVVK